MPHDTYFHKKCRSLELRLKEWFQRNSLAPHTPLPPIARHLCPRQSRGPGRIDRDVVPQWGPQTLGGLRFIGEATGGDGDENGSRSKVFQPKQLTKIAIPKLSHEMK
jgi:hypothetical protein